MVREGFARVSAAIPVCRVADVRGNLERTLALARASDRGGTAVVVFPELGLTGYTARDLFADHQLLTAARDALQRVVEASESMSQLIVVGLPLVVDSALYNVAATVSRGALLGLVPKSYLPNYREFEETRWFRAGLEVGSGAHVKIGPDEIPFGVDLLFEADNVRDLVVGVEICEDLWVQTPPSAFQVSAGATLVANLSASNFTVGKAGIRRMLARSASDRGKCAYLYVAAGPGESSTDLAFDADAFIYENGRELARSRRFSRTEQLVTADIDLELLVRERLVTTTFGDCAMRHRRAFRRRAFVAASTPHPPLARTVARHPFVPSDAASLGERCWEIFEIQTHALATRTTALGSPAVVVGVSGGLDSTQAALVAAVALDLRGQPRTDLHCVTMPGLGTTDSTRGNAETLAKALGATFHRFSIEEASRLVLELLGHPAASGTADPEQLIARLRQHPEFADIAVENVQARLRTLLLMTLANRLGGLVVGTGDLSEKALGWSTYGGDQISMYDVNAGVPKTLIQSVIAWVAREQTTTWSVGDPVGLRGVLQAILDTPISPELLPADPGGAILQLTEDAIGPYELHDFFLYHFVRHGARPGRVLDLAAIAFYGAYEFVAIKRWFAVFMRRFFSQQFKRSCTADAPKVGQVALSPRGDWRMPSDADVGAWLDAISAYPDEPA